MHFALILIFFCFKHFQTIPMNTANVNKKEFMARNIACSVSTQVRQLISMCLNTKDMDINFKVFMSREQSRGRITFLISSLE